MIITNLKSLFERDLNKLIREVESYTDEKLLWKVDKNITNSAGNLALHLVGNLNSFIGAELGNSGYVRRRDLEFSLKNVPRTELISQITETIAAVDLALSQLKESDLDAEYPVEVFDHSITTGYFLLHLFGHLGYHLGQINYHRRLLDPGT